jgi:head-tail adaptor
MIYQTPTRSTDVAGQQTVTWSDVTTLACAITPSQREVLDDLGVSVRTDISVESSYHASVVAKGRLKHTVSLSIYNIMSVTDPDAGRKRRLRILAAEIVP